MGEGEVNTTPTKEQIKRKYENLQHQETVGYFMEIAAAQAQEIDELKAYVNELRDALFEAKGHIRGPEEAYSAAREAYEQAPAQSLAAHDAAIEEEVIDRCANEADEALSAEKAVYGSIKTHNAATSVRNIPRKYNVR